MIPATRSPSSSTAAGQRRRSRSRSAGAPPRSPAAAAGSLTPRMSDDAAPLVLVSNRGPVTFQDDGSLKRGTGGLVTALTGLASHREAVWIASTMTERDAEV